MSEVTVRTATLSDLSKVEQLKKDAYSVRGYCPQPGAIEQYLTTDNALVLIAETAEKEAVGTVSILYDTGTIPTDEVFPEKTAFLRRTSTQIAYIGSFAVRNDLWTKKGSLSIGITLICDMLDRATSLTVDMAIIVVNPRHVRFYRALGFEEVASCGNMPGLEKAPGVMLSLNSEGIRKLIEGSTSGSFLRPSVAL